jgi:hypothetical protein
MRELRDALEMIKIELGEPTKIDKLQGDLIKEYEIHINQFNLSMLSSNELKSLNRLIKKINKF